MGSANAELIAKEAGLDYLGVGEDGVYRGVFRSHDITLEQSLRFTAWLIPQPHLSDVAQG